ncbi:hypothetical protein KGM_213601 [Danaus plexippus plexippus]|uniref:Uncharacterized protein n=1 Tax=Danaus plexippus plexippus TaxID=278856 RepID=A0A212ENY0_DANPL|nr:hypothetical protein KGM_213601 [Danaus plexippus plexippus]
MIYESGVSSADPRCELITLDPEHFTVTKEARARPQQPSQHRVPRVECRMSCVVCRVSSVECRVLRWPVSGRRSGRRWNATGNRFQEGRGPLPCRISPAVKRADKCADHLRQQRAMHRRPPGPVGPPRALAPGPRGPPGLRRCIPNDIKLETSRTIVNPTAFYIITRSPEYALMMDGTNTILPSPAILTGTPVSDDIIIFPNKVRESLAPLADRSLRPL